MNTGFTNFSQAYLQSWAKTVTHNLLTIYFMHHLQSLLPLLQWPCRRQVVHKKPPKLCTERIFTWQEDSLPLLLRCIHSAGALSKRDFFNITGLGLPFTKFFTLQNKQLIWSKCKADFSTKKCLILIYWVLLLQDKRCSSKNERRVCSLS